MPPRSGSSSGSRCADSSWLSSIALSRSEQVEDESGDVLEHGCVERVDELLSPSLAADQIGGLQHVEMVRERTLGHRETLGDPAGSLRAGLQEFQDPAPARVRKSLEDLLCLHYLIL